MLITLCSMKRMVRSSFVSTFSLRACSLVYLTLAISAFGSAAEIANKHDASKPTKVGLDAFENPKESALSPHQHGDNKVIIKMPETRAMPSRVWLIRSSISRSLSLFLSCITFRWRYRARTWKRRARACTRRRISERVLISQALISFGAETSNGTSLSRRSLKPDDKVTKGWSRPGPAILPFPLFRKLCEPSSSSSSSTSLVLHCGRKCAHD